MDPIRLVHSQHAKKRISRPARESLFNWLWVVVFIGAVLYLQVLIFDMRAQTDRLSSERRSFEAQIQEVNIINSIFSKEFEVSAEGLLDRLRDAQFEYRYGLFNTPQK